MGILGAAETGQVIIRCAFTLGFGRVKKIFVHFYKELLLCRTFETLAVRLVDRVPMQQ